MHAGVNESGFQQYIRLLPSFNPSQPSTDFDIFHLQYQRHEHYHVNCLIAVISWVF